VATAWHAGWKRISEKAICLTIRDTTALEEVSFLKIGRPSPPGSLRNEGKPCGVIRNRWEAAVSGANPELADHLFSETLAGTDSYCYRPGDLKESSGKPF
jgi:hypothetical protein